MPTDIHAAHGDWPVRPTPPFVPGHEGVGLVEALGSGVTSLAVGERVAVPWLGYACGNCESCLAGRETLCLDQRNTGYSCDGRVRREGSGRGRVREPGPGRYLPLRRRAAALCGGHDIQGG